jgi:hypothetical protein
MRLFLSAAALSRAPDPSAPCALLVERARARRTAFDYDEHYPPPLGSICDRVDCIE